MMLEIIKIIILTCQINYSNDISLSSILEKQCQKDLIKCVNPDPFTNIDDQKRLLKCLKNR